MKAWPASTGVLTARLPADLPAGKHSVVVQGPGGEAAQLNDALCVDAEPFQELIQACLMDIGQGVMDICSTSLDGGLHKKVVVYDAVPGIAQGAGTNQTESLWHGFTLSPDGMLLAFLRWNLPALVDIFPDFPERVLVVSAGDPMWRGGLSGPGSLYIHAERPLISGNGTRKKRRRGTWVVSTRWE